MIFSENRFPLCANAALRVRIMLSSNEETIMIARRRDFVTLAAGGAVAATVPAHGAQPRIKAVAFDVRYFYFRRRRCL
jgi:hypothetical protein